MKDYLQEINIKIRERKAIIAAGEYMLELHTPYRLAFDFDEEWPEEPKTVELIYRFAEQEGVITMQTEEDAVVFSPLFMGEDGSVHIRISCGELQTEGDAAITERRLLLCPACGAAIVPDWEFFDARPADYDDYMRRKQRIRDGSPEADSDPLPESQGMAYSRSPHTIKVAVRERRLSFPQGAVMVYGSVPYCFEFDFDTSLGDGMKRAAFRFQWDDDEHCEMMRVLEITDGKLLFQARRVFPADGRLYLSIESLDGETMNDGVIIVYRGAECVECGGIVIPGIGFFE